jgi:sugar phosphate isomerase/epimerase
VKLEKEMQFAFSSNAFRRFSLRDTIRVLAELGYEGVEIMADVPHACPLDLSERDINGIREELDRHGMEISNVNAFTLYAEGDVYHPSWIENDPSLRRRRLEHTLRCIDLTARLGARTLSTEPGGPLGGMQPEDGLRLFKEGLDAIHDRAGERGVRVLIEPEPGLLIETSSQFCRFFQELDPEVFGLNFDIGHFFCVGEDPVALVSTLKDHTHHFHLEDIASSKTHCHLMPGDGAIDLAKVLEAIADIGYAGFVTVELYPYEDRPVEAAEQALTYLRENGLRLPLRLPGETSA